MVSVYQTDKEGRHICPECHRAYEPDFDSKEEAKEKGESYQKEQYITGLCSDECWQSYLSI